MKLHEAIETVLREAGKPLKPAEIAARVNAKALYARGDGQPVPSSQISLRVKNYAKLFIKQVDGTIALVNGAETPESKRTTSSAPTGSLSDFSAPVRIADLRSDTSLIPECPGVYLVLRRKKAAPVFLPVGSGGHYGGDDPNVPIAELESNWIPGEEIVYIGMTRSSLRHRIGTYLRFGAGQPVGHWGGRYIWQLQDHEDLEFCWKAMPTGDPNQLESQLIDLFKQQHGGKRPFANLSK